MLAPLPFQPCLAWTEPVPKGVVGVMAPWNYPIQLLVEPLAIAIARHFARTVEEIFHVD